MQAAAKAEVASNRNKNKPLESAGALERQHVVVPPAHSSWPGGQHRGQHHGQHHEATLQACASLGVKRLKGLAQRQMAGTCALVLKSECREVAWALGG